MGCKGSKLDEQQAVVLCRGRSELLAAAVRNRFFLADSHAAVTACLISFSDSLLLLNLPESPTLSLPPHRKPDPSPPPNHQVDRSHSGSHLHFHDSEPESDNESVHSSIYSPLHQQSDYIINSNNINNTSSAMPYLPYRYPITNDNYANNFNPNYNYYQNNDGANNTNNNGFYNIYYAKSKPPKPSVTIQQPPPNAETGHSTYGYNNLYSNPYFYGETGNGFYSGEPETRAATSARAPPSPPKVNTWDFLNPFENSYNYNYENNYYPVYTPSRSSREVRDEEGIPDLEPEEEIYNEVVKEAYGDDKSIASRSTQEDFQSRRSDVEKTEVQETVDKKVVNNKEIKRSNRSSNNNNHNNNNNNNNNNKRRESLEVSELINEIKNQFERASEAAKELGLLLEVGKRRYETNKNPVYQVSSRVVLAMAPVSANGDSYNLEHNNKEINESNNNNSLCMTLQKLYIWEKKLYDEVKGEEKMRLLLSKTTKRLKALDERGAETHRIDATRKLARKLTTKIRIAIQVVNSISNKITVLRDEELWPQLHALIQGFTRMWRQILDCYEIQSSLISNLKSQTQNQNLDSIISNKKSLQLELELIKFSVNFSSWVNTQKSFIKSLNGWLSLCLNPEPELTSETYVGTPPIFTICNKWSREIERVEESRVVECMRCLARILKREMESHVFLQGGEQLGLVKERERWAREMERSFEINKEMESLNKKLVLVPGENGLSLLGLSLTSGTRLGSEGFGEGFKGLIEEFKKFAESEFRVYEGLSLHAERVCREELSV